MNNWFLVYYFWFMISTFLLFSGQKGQHLTATVLTVGPGDTGLQSRLTDAHMENK